MAYVPPHRRGGQQQLKIKRVITKNDNTTSTEIICSAFPQICCINLDRRTDKWTAIQRQAAQIDLPIERISAIDGTKWIAEGRLDEKEVDRQYVAEALSLIHI